MSVERLVVKVGTGFLYHKLDNNICTIKPNNFSGLVQEIAGLANSGIEVALVTSGAIGTASFTLGVPVPTDNYERARMAGIGQPRLMNFYINEFKKHKLTTAQFLACKDDFQNTKSRRNIRRNQEAYFGDRTIGIYNENDLLAIDEIKYGDNDGLAADIACCLDADLLVMLSDPTEKLGTGGGNSKEKARESVKSKGIDFVILNGDYKKAKGLYLPKIRECFI